MQRISSKLVVLIGLAWVLGQTACLSKPVDKSLLTGRPCEPPCWQQIVPRQTTQDTALAVLSQSDYVDSKSVQWGENTGSGGYSWRSNAGAIYNWLVIQDGMVQWINVELDFPLTLEQLIERYGSPDKVMAMRFSEGEVITRVFLFYFEKGFQVVLADFSQSQVILSQSTIVKRVIYRPPVSGIEELQRDIFKSPDNVIKLYVQYSYDWDGYGQVKNIVQ